MTDKIPKNAELVIFDFYNTLVVNSEEGLKFRDSIFGLIVTLKLRGKKIAISSTSPIEKILDFPGFLNISSFVGGVYGKEHVIKEERTYKDLGSICKEMEVEPDKAVMIGDDYNKIDQRSAEKFGVCFIPVPDGDTEQDYDMKNLI